MLALFKNRNFRLMAFGESISLIGDQISLLAFPWLVLTLTDSPFQMGVVLALQGLPRAILMLMGGAMVDRFSPRAVMLASNLARLVLVLTLGLMLVFEAVSIAWIFALALAFGIADAFFFPATGAILPSLVRKDELKAGNAIIQGLAQFSLVAGPLIAGSVIFASSGQPMPDLTEGLVERPPLAGQSWLAVAFFIDAATFGVSALMLSLLRPRALHDEEEESQGFLATLKEPLIYAWRHPAMRLFFIAIAGLEIFFNAPFLIGIPVYAHRHLAEGALAYVLVTGAYGLGGLLGGFTAALLPTPPDRHLGRVMFLLVGYSGLTLVAILLTKSTWVIAAIFFSAGLGDGFVIVHFSTWLQRATPGRLLGRVMSILMFLAFGLLPISEAIMGALIEWNLEAVFLGAGLTIMVICLIAASHPDARRLGDTPKGYEAELKREQTA